MLEWVCQECDRLVDPAFESCPFCAEKGASPGRAATVRSAWSIADRVFRVLIWVVGLSALIYFWIFLWAYHTGRDELLFRLARYIPRLH